MSRFGIWLVLLALVSSLAISTLSGQTAPAGKTQKSAEKPTSPLSHEIHHQILSLPFYSVFDSIEFTLEGKKVILTGQVLRRTLKEHAEAAVKSIEGVDSVVNQIEILPTSPSDDDLRTAVYRALYEDSTLAHYAVQNVPPLHIIVSNGNVALAGSVDSLSDKNLAGSLTGKVTNVLSVRNNLVVRAKENAAE
ncbi:MAG: BON domain-containing protein [Candidatus Acidiferrum sp.]